MGLGKNGGGDGIAFSPKAKWPGPAETGDRLAEVKKVGHDVHLEPLKYMGWQIVFQGSKCSRPWYYPSTDDALTTVELSFSAIYTV